LTLTGDGGKVPSRSTRETGKKKKRHNGKFNRGGKKTFFTLWAEGVEGIPEEKEGGGMRFSGWRGLPVSSKKKGDEFTSGGKKKKGGGARCYESGGLEEK